MDSIESIKFESWHSALKTLIVTIEKQLVFYSVSLNQLYIQVYEIQPYWLIWVCIYIGNQ